MITFDLLCTMGHRFEGWFGSSTEYARQSEMGLLVCPACGDKDIAKAITAPYIGRKGNQSRPMQPQQTPAAAQIEEAEPVSLNKPSVPAIDPAIITAPATLSADLVAKMAAMQSEILKSSDYVGGNFADNARAIHYGEAENRLIHGEATPDQAKELHEEGIAIMPLLFPVIAPNQKN